MIYDVVDRTFTHCLITIIVFLHWHISKKIQTDSATKGKMDNVSAFG